MFCSFSFPSEQIRPFFGWSNKESSQKDSGYGYRLFLKLVECIAKMVFQIVVASDIKINVENGLSSELWFLFVFLWGIHRTGASEANSFLVIMSERLQSTGPFSCTEQWETSQSYSPPSRVWLQVQLTVKRECTKDRRQWWSQGNQIHPYTIFKLSILFFQRICRWYYENYKSIKYTFIKDLLTLKKSSFDSIIY